MYSLIHLHTNSLPEMFLASYAKQSANTAIIQHKMLKIIYILIFILKIIYITLAI